MKNDSRNKELYKNLGLRIISDKEFHRLQDNVSDFYRIHNFSYFNPNFKFFSNYLKSYYTMNNSNKLYKLLKKTDRRGTSGYFFKSKIKSKNNTIFHKNVFVKEISIFNPNNIESYYETINNSVCSPSINNQIISDIIYDPNEECNIELFINYLVSKLKELDISPHFCEYYGSYSVELDKFTFNITDDEEILDNLEKITENQDIPLNVIDKDGIYLEYSNVPVYLLITEKLNHDVSYLKENNELTYNIIVSLTFQIFSAIITMNHIFGIKHNDLHFGNVMLKNTKEKYLYYKVHNSYYKIPTYGYIICILDWGRSTYDFNGFTGKNSVYSADRDCFQQYIFNKMNSRGLESLECNKNCWTDIVMISHSILSEFEEVLEDTELKKLLVRNITTSSNNKLDIEEFNWELYLKITNYKFNINPNKLLTSHIFSKFKIKKKLTKNKCVYDLYF
tara:strand:- start:2661 stop:4007 length:1347 start_codon:yes stop_codon:yes gene_type:complete